MNIIPNKALAVIAGSLLVLTSACGSGGSDLVQAKVTVVASTDVWGSVAEAVAGKRLGQDVSVTSIITDPAADPHSYEASTRTQLALSKADVVIENGGGYDDFVTTMRKARSKKGSVVLNAVDISGKKATDGELNEHVWYDFPTVAKVADRVAAALSKADPTHRAAYEKNAAAFDAQLQKLEQSEGSIKAAHAGAGVAITEPVPLYLLQACGLVDRTPEKFSEAVEEGTDVSPTVLQQTLDLFSTKAVSALVYNEQTTGAETKAVLAAAKKNDVPVVPVTETLPEGKDYLSWMRDNLAAVQRALG